MASFLARSIGHTQQVLSKVLPTVGDAAGRAMLAVAATRTKMIHKLDDFINERLGKEFYERLRRVPSSLGEAEVDPFGLDPQYAKYTLALASVLHRYYFRSQIFGAEHIPAGRVMLVANHSGQLPIDGAMIGAALFLDAEPPRFCRAMVEKWSQTLPFVSFLFARAGHVVGLQENARELLYRDEALLVFPEGVKGISKPFQERYKLTEFGNGFLRLALETHTPIVPVSVIGAEEQYISIGNLDRVGAMFGAPSFPILPQLLLPLGFLPLPTRYRIYFGEPLYFEGDPDEDDIVIAEKVGQVKAKIEAMLDDGLKTREHIFF